MLVRIWSYRIELSYTDSRGINLCNPIENNSVLPNKAEYVNLYKSGISLRGRKPRENLTLCRRFYGIFLAVLFITKN